MTVSPFRSSGGVVDQGRPLTFSFDGRRLQGFAGDTLASALLAAGVGIGGRSFKYHRPRGVLGAGVEEPNVLVQVGEGGRLTTNLRATEVELIDGLQARSLNRWPSLNFDLAAVNDLIGGFLPAGFYYKTFIWPGWKLYEAPIRRAAGIGRPGTLPDPDQYETRFAHVDVLVVGTGPSGLAAARAAAVSGASVMVCDQDFQLGGSLLWSCETVEGRPGADWARRVLSELSSHAAVTLAPRMTAIAYHDHNMLVLVERTASGDPIRERLWRVRASKVVLATGAIERPLVFEGNDRPGVMLISAATQYAARYAAHAGARAVIVTNNDTAYSNAEILLAHGVQIGLLADTRPNPPQAIAAPLTDKGVRLITGVAAVAAKGWRGVRSVEFQSPTGRVRVGCDCLLMSGGWNPTAHLFSQSGGRLRYDPGNLTFRPEVSAQVERSAGAANGFFALANVLADGVQAGAWAAGLATLPDETSEPLVAAEPAISAAWTLGGGAKAFVDFQSDVTVRDVHLAARENLSSVELLKRYTALGMGTDQGKTGNVNGLAILGSVTGREPGEVGTTRYRPPYTPTSFAAFGGQNRGPHFRPIRRTPMHEWHASEGADFEDLGGWLRPDRYVHASEDREASISREARAVRERCGLLDASSLGKIEVTGPDAAVFLDRVYAAKMSTLRAGRLRYGLMLSELGVIIDDGVVARVGPESFVLTTTSAGAERIGSWLEEWLQCEWRELRTIVSPVTADRGVATLTGPLAPQVLEAAGCDFSSAPAALPHMAFHEGRVADVAARVARVSFTGEISYEISAKTDDVEAIWFALLAAGRPYGLEPIGVGALMLLRTEKGYIHVGSDTDGTTIPDDIGWTRVAGRADDFIGKRSLAWEINRRPDRHQLVGVVAEDPGANLVAGHHLQSNQAGAAPTEGFVTSAGFSPSLGRHVALALLRGGRARTGEVLRLTSSGAQVRVSHACAYDPDGKRLR